MTDQVQLSFVDHSKVPQRIWNSAEGAKIREKLQQMKTALGNNLEKVDLGSNAGLVHFGTEKVLNGAIYHVKKGTLMSTISPFLGPLYQRFSVFDMGKIDDAKVASCKSKWNDIIDPPAAKGSGLPGYGTNVHIQTDLVEMYEHRNRGEAKQWYTSLGTNYPSFAMVSVNKHSQGKLFIAGGHEQLHRKISELIAKKTDSKIEDVADKRLGLESDSSFVLTVKMIKDLQIVNHSRIASKVLTSLGAAKHASDPYNDFSTPVSVNCGGFYNTIREVTNQTGSTGQTFAVAQGIIDTLLDLNVSDATETVGLYMIESPERVHELNIHKEYLEKVRYFPLTTGSSEIVNLGGSELKADVHWTGISNINNIRHTSFQPYDPILKKSTNMLFDGHGYAAVESEQTFDSVVCSITGCDPRNTTVEDYLKNTASLDDKSVVKAPVNSQPVKLIFDTFPRVLDVLKSEGVTGVGLSNVFQSDNESSHFVCFPLGSLRLADKVSKDVCL